MRRRFLSSIIALALALAAAVLPAGPAMEAYAGSALDDVKFNMTVTGLDEYNDVWLNLSFSYSGIVAGSDDFGTYKPDIEIKRSEVAAILIRFIDAKARVGAPSRLGQQ